MPDKYQRNLRRKRRRAKKGTTYNEDYDAGLKKQGYTVVKSSPTGQGTRIIHVEKKGIGSTIMRKDNPRPENKGPRMKVVKKAPRYKKGRMTRRKMGGFI